MQFFLLFTAAVFVVLDLGVELGVGVLEFVGGLFELSVLLVVPVELFYKVLVLFAPLVLVSVALLEVVELVV